MKHTALSVRWPLSIITCAILTGCAVTNQQVAEEGEKKMVEIAAAHRTLQTLPSKPQPLRRISGNYVGGQPLAVSHSLALPPNAREVVLNFGNSFGSIEDVARNVRSATGITVRINSDVNVGRAVQTAPAAATSPMPLPGVPMPGGAVALPTPVRRTGDLPLFFSGDLGDYLNQITGALGVSWEYANGEIHIYRKVTRTFSLMISPGSMSVRDDISSSGNSESGGGTASSRQAGSFGSNSQASSQSNYNPWEAIDQALKTMISSDGKFTVNQSSGTIVVSDSKEVVDRIGDWVKQENGALTRQVAIEVREIAVELRNGSQIGVDLNLVYQRLNAASGVADWVFRFGAPSSLTDGTAGSLGFNVARPDSRLSGTNVAVQALNSMGNIVFDSTRTVVTTNRVPGRLQDVTDRAYLAETTPGSGGSSGSGGVSLPGLKPGVVTYGDNLILLPTIGENNVVLLQLFSTRSSLLELNSVSAGQGVSFQQINTPVLSRKKNAQNFQMAQGETLIIVGNNSESWTSRDNHSLTGGSRTANQNRTINVLLVTPRVMSGA